MDLAEGPPRTRKHPRVLRPAPVSYSQPWRPGEYRAKALLSGELNERAPKRVHAIFDGLILCAAQDAIGGGE